MDGVTDGTRAARVHRLRAKGAMFQIRTPEAEAEALATHFPQSLPEEARHG